VGLLTHCDFALQQTNIPVRSLIWQGFLLVASSMHFLQRPALAIAMVDLAARQ